MSRITVKTVDKRIAAINAANGKRYPDIDSLYLSNRGFGRDDDWVLGSTVTGGGIIGLAYGTLRDISEYLTSHYPTSK